MFPLVLIYFIEFLKIKRGRIDQRTLQLKEKLPDFQRLENRDETFPNIGKEVYSVASRRRLT